MGRPCAADVVDAIREERRAERGDQPGELPLEKKSGVVMQRDRVSARRAEDHRDAERDEQRDGGDEDRVGRRLRRGFIHARPPRSR